MPRAGPKGSRSAGGGPSPAISGPAGFSIWIADGDAAARKVHEHAQPVRLAGPSLAGTGETGALSADETLVALSVSEDGDVLHPSLRVIDATTGDAVGELRDEGRQLAACGFSPIPGDARLAITHERTGEERPAVWDPRTGEVVDLELELVGPVEAVDWWPDGSARCSCSSSSRGATASTAST